LRKEMEMGVKHPMVTKVSKDIEILVLRIAETPPKTRNEVY